MHIATEPVKSQAEGQALAQALLDRLANGYIAAEGVCDGNPQIKAGAKVSVFRVGQKFSGTYRVAASTHVLRGGSTYETHFANSPAHTLLGAVGSDRTGGSPSFGGQLVLGIVTNNDDPDAWGACGSATRRWPPTPRGLGADRDAERRKRARGADAPGRRRGGADRLRARRHHPALRARLAVQRSGHPGRRSAAGKDGSFALLSDHQIYMDSTDDYTIKSAKKMIVEIDDNVEEKYKRDWTGEITGKASLKSTQPFEIEGQNVSIKGQAQLDLEGTATLTLKCGGTQIQLSSAGVQISGPMITLG